MKVYLQPDTYSKGVVRVCDALMRYAPESVELVQKPWDADFEVIHVYGRHDAVERRVAMLESKNKPFAMIQYALRSTIRPDTHDWIDMWGKAKLVWSYYDLPELCRQDGLFHWLQGAIDDFPYGNFYYAPLGVDAEVFKDYGHDRRFIVGACSKHALAEGARECSFAAKRVQKPMFFLGHELRRGPDIVCKQNISDIEVANYFSQCRYISGLRRIEGFELPVIEGALCGARPIVYDRPHYRKWFNDFAIFLPELPRDEMIDAIESVFRQDLPQVTEDEKKVIRERFDWSKIINGFWEKVL